ncbi:peroxidase mlt-7-like [Rhopalosiphum maidis]|uniref:peroxidase mlt-7-like n=1 Tax=Rhopalosiphum maidis TaxID=43146 RepID=UPI000EFE479D|nr:peroxidase mlt-7-like [Rhopalosiphum maidis]
MTLIGGFLQTDLINRAQSLGNSITRTADRYFYDLPGIFNKNQLEQIRNMTLARVFCDNNNNVTTMQKQAFMKPASSSELLPCNFSQLIPEINLIHWQELVDIMK